MKNSKISPLEKAKTFQERFNIDNADFYGKFFIVDMNFDRYLKNKLIRNGCVTLADLLKHSENSLENIKSIGKASRIGIMPFLENFFEKNKQTPVKKRIRILREDAQLIDNSLIQAARRKNSYIEVIIEAFGDFSQSLAFREENLRDLRKKIQDAPDYVKSKKILPFFRAYNLMNGKSCDEKIADLLKDIVVSDFPDYLGRNPNLFMKIINFVVWLEFDPKVALEDLIVKSFAEITNVERAVNIVLSRMNGGILDRISKNFGVTRERTRQIEANVTGKFVNACMFKRLKFFFILYAINGGKPVMNMNEIKDFPYEEYLPFLKKMMVSIPFDEEILKYDPQFEKLRFLVPGYAEITSKEITDFFPETVFEEDFYNLIDDFAQKKNCLPDFVKAKLDEIYKRSGKCFHRIKLTLNFKCDHVLKHYFKTGYKIDNKTHYNEFIRHMREVFNKDEFMTHRAVDAKIMTFGVLWDRGKYIHKDFVNVPKKIVERINDFIDASDRTALTYKEIYEEMKDELKGTQITDGYKLQGVLKFYGCRNNLARDYVTKDLNKKISSIGYNYLNSYLCTQNTM